MDFPTVIQNPGKISDVSGLKHWVASEREHLANELERSGAILFRGFPVQSAKNFDEFAMAFGFEHFTYEESLSNAVRINLTPRVFTANEAPPDVEIFLHHEMAQTPIYPHRLFFCCLSAASEGGATPLCRSDLLWQDFKSHHPELALPFEELGLKYTTHMPVDDDSASGQGRSWRSTLSVKDKAEAEARLSELDYSWEWSDNDSLLATTGALPAVRDLKDGSQSFFNQVIAAHKGWKRHINRQSVLTFGDGSEIPRTSLDLLADISTRYTVPCEWQDGDVALVDNYRVMHGRYPFSGDRKRQVVVCLAR
jgi:hypothetical protein